MRRTVFAFAAVMVACAIVATGVLAARASHESPRRLSSAAVRQHFTQQAQRAAHQTANAPEAGATFGAFANGMVANNTVSAKFAGTLGRIGAAIGDLRQIARYGSKTVYLAVGPTNLCQIVSDTDGSAVVGCSSIVSAADPATPLATTTSDGSVADLVVLLPDSVDASKLVASGGQELASETSSNSVHASVPAGGSESLKVHTTRGWSTVRLDPAAGG